MRPLPELLPATVLVLLALLPARGARAQPAPYPPALRDSVVDDYHGVRIADPYRWLETLDSPATVTWVRAQERLTTEQLRRVPSRETIRRRLTALWSYRRTEVPWREAGRVFYVENAGLERQASLYVSDSLGHAPRKVLDPQALSPDGSTEISDFAVSPDGRWLAYSTSPGGADAGEMRVRDLASGRDLPDAVRGTWGSACWTFDGGGFFYVRPPEARPGAANIEKQLFYHLIGRPPAEDRLIHTWTDEVRWLYAMMSDEGRWALAVAQRGSQARMYVMDLREAKAPDLAAPLVPLLAGREADYTPMGTVGSTLFVLTDLDAPRRRVIALDLAAGAEARPRAVVPESSAVIQSATVAGDRLALHYLVDVKSRLALFTLDGRPAGDVALPGIGAVEWPLNGRASAPELFYSFTSFLSPSTVYRYDLASGRSTPFRAPRVPFDPAPYETRQIFVRSKDGTRVPMFITARRDLRPDGSHPTLLTAYGGFGAIQSPRYQPDVALWLERGGVYAVANLRGGGEYGESWHRAGSLEHKQNSFDDFAAAAAYLERERITSPRRLAIYGHSNGGMMIGAALTQHPELYAAAVASAGHHDMLRFHRFTVGAGWIPEYGSPDRAADFRWLRAYSPLHNVRAGTCYPATLLLTADHDDRVVPSHSYKFAAALQAAQACSRPILLRVARNASHGYESGAEAIAERTDMLAFLEDALGMAAGSRVRGAPHPAP